MERQNGWMLSVFVLMLLLQQGCQVNARAEHNDKGSVLSSNQTECPSPVGSMTWLYYQGNCYSFNNESFFTYDAGKEFCKINGGLLVSIHSPSEMHFISGKVSSYMSSYWIGMRRYDSSFPPKWEDDSRIDYSNFHNDAEYYDGMRCALFDTSDGYWRWQPCDLEAQVICKLQKDNGHFFPIKRVSRDSPGFCPDDWYSFDDKCYKLFGRTSWSNADTACAAQHSDLVSIHSQEEQTFLKLLVAEARLNAWIGLKRSSIIPSEFSWSDKTHLDFTYWAEGEPNNHQELEKCVHMHYVTFGTGEWNDAMCSHTNAFICEKPKDPTLKQPGRSPSLCSQPKDWVKFRNSCYNVFHETKSYASWSGSQSLCKSFNGNLVHINDYTVTLLMQYHLKGLQGPFWTGVKSTRKHQYGWLGKYPLVYSNWGKDEPKDLPDEQNCVAVDSDSSWMVRDCDENHPFICEVDKDVTEAPTMEPYHENMTCPSSSSRWHDLGGKYCYIIELSKNVKWHEASCRCEQEGGFLASFHSMKEINTIRHYVKHHDASLHIGFIRDKQGRFVWSDGSAINFVYWNSGEPNHNLEKCAEMHVSTGKWNDILCSSTHGYVCSALKVPVHTKVTGSLGESSNLKDHEKGEKQLGAGGIALIITCVLLVVVISLVSIYFLVPSVKTKFMGKITYSGIQ